MFLKKVLNQPNLVGTVMIVLMVCSGFVYAFAFDGFNVETATGGEVEAWLAEAGGGGSGEDEGCTCGYDKCPGEGCSDCTTFSCKSEIGCGTCGCATWCSNANGKVCGSHHGVCIRK